MSDYCNGCGQPGLRFVTHICPPPELSDRSPRVYGSDPGLQCVGGYHFLCRSDFCTCWCHPSGEREHSEALYALGRCGPLLSGTFCLKRPTLKTEPWDGPCGKCSHCMARAIWYDADGSLSALARAALACPPPEEEK